MSAPGRGSGWTEANQRLLAAEFARIRALLGDGDAALANAEGEARRTEMPAPAAIDTVANLFQLSAFERDVLLLAAGAEMDAHLAALCGQAAGHPQRPWATFGLALAALPDPHWSALAPPEPLRRWRLVEPEDGGGLTSARLKIDERVLHFIAGFSYPDHRLQPLLAPVPPPGPMSATHRDIAARAAARMRAVDGRLPVLLLDGDDTAGQQEIAAAIAAHLGIGLYRLRGRDVPVAASEQAALAVLWTREAALLGCGLFVAIEDVDAETHVARLMPHVNGVVIVGARYAPSVDAPALHYVVDRPDAAERRQLWKEALGVTADALGPAVDGLASQYRLGAQRIAAIVASASDDDPARCLAALHRASRAARPRLDDLAPAHRRRAPAGTISCCRSRSCAALREIAVHVRQRPTRLRRRGASPARARAGWASARCSRATAAPARRWPPRCWRTSCGSTCTASTSSAVVSKYIGETEKNLRARLRRRRRGRRDPAVRRGRRAVRQAQRGARTATTATPTSRSATCCSGWRPIAGSPS